MRKFPVGVIIAWSGLAVSIISLVLVSSTNDLSGLAYAPFVWGGFLGFIVGLVKTFLDFKSSGKQGKIMIAVTWVVAALIGFFYFLQPYITAKNTEACQDKLLHQANPPADQYAGYNYNAAYEACRKH
jgi:predicted PurR-regulated permease PerM